MTEVLGGLLAFLGGGLGAWLTFRATQRTTALQERQGRREEWGRRFTAALDMLADREERRQVVGAALLAELARSPLADREEQHLAEIILDEAARFGEDQDIPAAPAGIAVDSSVVVEDDGGHEAEEP